MVVETNIGMYFSQKRKLEEVTARNRITLDTLEVLLAGQNSTTSEIAKDLGIGLRTVSFRLKELREKGYTARRGTSLTEKGLELYLEAEKELGYTSPYRTT